MYAFFFLIGSYSFEQRHTQSVEMEGVGLRHPPLSLCQSPHSRSLFLSLSFTVLPILSLAQSLRQEDTMLSLFARVLVLANVRWEKEREKGGSGGGEEGSQREREREPCCKESFPLPAGQEDVLVQCGGC